MFVTWMLAATFWAAGGEPESSPFPGESPSPISSLTLRLTTAKIERTERRASNAANSVGSSRRTRVTSSIYFAVRSGWPSHRLSSSRGLSGVRPKARTLPPCSSRRPTCSLPRSMLAAARRTRRIGHDAHLHRARSGRQDD